MTAPCGSRSSRRVPLPSEGCAVVIALSPLVPPTSCEWEWAASIPVAHRIEAQMVRHGSRTKIKVVDVVFDQGLPDSMFSSARLDKLRR